MRRALGFLSIFGSAEPPTSSTLAWFPAAGLVLGAIVGGSWWLAARLWPPVVAAAVVVALDVVVTGGLHVDGLADAADGLLPPMSRARRLEVMADPRVGAFAVVAVVVALLARFSALAAVAPAPFAIAGLWCASRTALILVCEMPYARGVGLATNFLTPSATSRRWRRAAVLVGLALSSVLVAYQRHGRGFAALGGELVAIALVSLFARRRIGGFTGDVLGAATVVGETVGLLVLATR